MKRFRFFRRLSYAICLCATALFVVSCSEEPASGPISPLQSTQQQKARSNVRPLPRKADESTAVKSLAKGSYTDEQLIAMINQQSGLSMSELGFILLRESPLSSNVLMAVLQRDPKLPPLFLKTVLLASTPLPVAVAQAIQEEELLSGRDLRLVMEAQAGFTGHFLDTKVSKWMTASEGGEIWHGGHKIEFPPGALMQDAYASISISPSNYIQVDFGPDGWFNREVTVAISYKNVDLSGVDENALTLSWYDETADQWIEVASRVDTRRKYIFAQVWHFTQYTISVK
ncbi:hypothetical protein FBQ85_25750 [Cytophagia bacterium CHB2]|nr:hypothetical protein [Cytophagia bacterium CHB2]